MKTAKLSSQPKKKPSKAELATFFTLFEIEYDKIKKYYIFSWLFFTIFIFRGLLEMDFHLTLSILGLIFVLTIFHCVFYYKFSMTWKDYYKQNIKDFISFLMKKGKKRTEYSKFIIERLEKAQIHDRKFYTWDFFLKGLFIVLSIFFIYFLLYEYVLFFFFGFGILVLSQSPLYLIFCLVFFFAFVAIFQVRYVDYNNVNEAKEIFKYYINNELSEIEENIETFIQKPNDQIAENFGTHTSFLTRWYDIYCSRFFENSEFNDIIFQYEELIFDDDENEFYYELFSSLKIRITDYTNSKSESENESVDVNAEKSLKIVQNYINLLDLNIKISNERKRKRMEKLSIWQKWIYLIVVPISFVINLIISFVF